MSVSVLLCGLLNFGLLYIREIQSGIQCTLPLFFPFHFGIWNSYYSVQTFVKLELCCCCFAFITIVTVLLLLLWLPNLNNRGNLPSSSQIRVSLRPYYALQEITSTNFRWILIAYNGVKSSKLIQWFMTGYQTNITVFILRVLSMTTCKKQHVIFSFNLLRNTPPPPRKRMS